MKEKNNNTTYDNTKLLKFLKENFQYLTAFPAILYGIAMIIKRLYSYIYSIKAEEFYGIPRKYFYENVLGNVNISIFLFILCILVIISPTLIKRIMRRKKLSNIDGIIYSVMVNLLILQILLITAIRIIDTTKLNINNIIFGIISIEKIILIVIFIILIISFYVYFKLFTSEDPNIEEGENVKNKIQNKQKLDLTRILFIFILLIVLFAIIFLMVNILDINLEDKKDYEVAEVKKIENIDKNKIMLVVGNYKENAILINIVDLKYNKIKFQKYSYQFEPLNDLKIKYVNFVDVSSENK